MEEKRSNEDNSRSIKEKIKTYEDITSNIGEVLEQVRQWLEEIISVNANIHSITTFLALAEYFLTQKNSRQQKMIE